MKNRMLFLNWMVDQKYEQSVHWTSVCDKIFRRDSFLFSALIIKLQIACKFHAESINQGRPDWLDIFLIHFFYYYKRKLNKSENHENNRQIKKLKVLNVLWARRKCTQTIMYWIMFDLQIIAGSDKTEAKRKRSIDRRIVGKNSFYYMIYAKTEECTNICRCANKTLSS